MTEDEMVGWHHWLDRHEFEQALGFGDEQGRLACYSPWGHKESERLSDWTELINWWRVFDGHHGFFQAPWVPNQLKKDLWITANEHLDVFLNVGNLALVNGRFYPGLLFVFSVNLKRKKRKTKRKQYFCCCCINFPPYHVTTILFLPSGHIVGSGGSTPIVLS